MATIQLSWPLVGRDDELELVGQALRNGAPGAVVSGAAGVGKTRLAREALAAASANGAQTEWVQATTSAASIPLGAFTGLMPPGVRADDQLQLFGLCADVLRERGGSQGVVLGVDDAQLLDPTSAALVLHLASTGTAFVVVTIRAGEPCPDSIVALWKDMEAPRLELQQLSERETSQLLEAALDGDVAAGVKRWAFDASEGHVLYLRELVKGALTTGALVEEDGVWNLRAQPRMSPALVELISGSLDGLGEEELDVVRILALGEPLDVDTITQITSRAAFSSVEEAGLAVVVTRASPLERAEVRLGHPLYGEVVRATLPTLRGDRLRARLAEDLRARGLERVGDALRIVAWLEDAGVAIDEPLLLAAARDANAAGDPELAERFALRLSSGPERAVLLGTSYALRRRFTEAEEVLAEVEGHFPTRELAHAYLARRATHVLHVGLSRTGDALDLLGRAEGWFPDSAWRDHVELLRDDLLVYVGGPAEVLDDLERLAHRDDALPEVRRIAEVQRTAALYFAGRMAEARALSERMLPSLPPRGELDAYTVMVWSAVRAAGGYDWDELERWLVEAERAADRTDLVMRGTIQNRLASVALRRGRPATATRWARESVDNLERADPFRELPLVCSYVVMCKAMRRDTAAARVALGAYEAALGDAPGFPAAVRDEATARAMLLAAEGETGRAQSTLLDAVEARTGYPIDQALLLHEAFRVGAPPGTVAPALENAAANCDAPLPAALARLVGAAAARDGRELTESAEALAEIGASLWAAEAAALAAAAFDDTGREDSARRAQALSSRLLDSCEDAWSPLLSHLGLARVELTRREREIVSLAADGATNAEIAERLVLSVRTVESHLYHAMRKLGVSTREELRAP